VRYDVNFDSIRTGHVFGIFFDHCALYAVPEGALSAVRGGVRTRSPLPLDEESATAEREHLAG
jgi:hypothetical protein